MSARAAHFLLKPEEGHVMKRIRHEAQPGMPMGQPKSAPATIAVWGTEFGRTPGVEGLEGGGGIMRGATDELGFHAVE